MNELMHRENERAQTEEDELGDRDGREELQEGRDVRKDYRQRCWKVLLLVTTVVLVMR